MANHKCTFRTWQFASIHQNRFHSDIEYFFLLCSLLFVSFAVPCSILLIHYESAEHFFAPAQAICSVGVFFFSVAIHSMLLSMMLHYLVRHFVFEFACSVELSDWMLVNLLHQRNYIMVVCVCVASEIMIRLGLNAPSQTDSQPHFALRFPSHVAGGSGID